MSDSFWINFIPNLLATLIALVAGVPIGLLVDRKIKKEQEGQRENLKLKRELEILELIKKEIKFCKIAANTTTTTNKK